MEGIFLVWHRLKNGNRYLYWPHMRVPSLGFGQKRASKQVKNSEASFRQESLTSNLKLTDLRKIIKWRKSDFSVERISVCNFTEKLMEHGTHCLPCS